MSIYTTLSDETISNLLAHYMLGTFIKAEGVAAGTQNTNYRVTTSQGQYMLTLYEKESEEAVIAMAQFVNFLREQGLPTAQCFATHEGNFIHRYEGKPVVFSQFLPGEHPILLTESQCYLVGDLLGRIHTVGASYSYRRDNPEDVQSTLTRSQALLDIVSPTEKALLEQEMAYQQMQDYQHLPKGLIHNDLFRDNLLFFDGKISGVFDFSDFCYDHLLRDLAHAVNDCCFIQGYEIDPKREAALLQGYQQHREIERAESAAWYAMLRLSALNFWVFRLQRHYNPPPGENVSFKDPKQFETIIAALSH